MVVRLFNQSDDAGVITDVTREICVVRTEAGDLIPLYWHEVELDAVAPHPAALPGQGWTPWASRVNRRRPRA
jgi:hypothetical protein